MTFQIVTYELSIEFVSSDSNLCFWVGCKCLCRFSGAGLQWHVSFRHHLTLWQMNCRSNLSPQILICIF